MPRHCPLHFRDVAELDWSAAHRVSKQTNTPHHALASAERHAPSSHPNHLYGFVHVLRVILMHFFKARRQHTFLDRLIKRQTEHSLSRTRFAQLPSTHALFAHIAFRSKASTVSAPCFSNVLPSPSHGLRPM